MKLIRELDSKAVEFYEFCDKVVPLQEDGALPTKFKLMLVMAAMRRYDQPRGKQSYPGYLPGWRGTGCCRMQGGD
jgi:hypothetical protein